jgi:disulfide bond formation protein DsbB
LTAGAGGTATATYQTSFANTGAHLIVAQFAKTSTLAASTGTVQVNIAAISSGVGTIALAATPATLTVTQGTSGNETLTITPAGGYLGTVLLQFNTSNNNALANLCYGFTTTLSNGDGSVAVTGTSAVTTQFALDTLATDCGAAPAPGGKSFHRLGGAKTTAKNNGPSPVPLGVAFAGLLLAGFLGRRSRKLHTIAGLIALLAASLAISACGSQTVTNSVPNPPKGTYTITVVAQDSVTSTITAQTTFKFTIQ